MKTIFKGFQLVAILIAIGSIISMFRHGSLVPLLFALGAWVIYSGAKMELKKHRG